MTEHFHVGANPLFISGHKQSSGGTVTTITFPIDFTSDHQAALRLVVTEGISSLYDYHLSHPQTFAQSLCGVHTATTGIQTKQWRKPFGKITPRWCVTCEQKAARIY
jgi:hypothetical protein